ncbi:unnamed protein product [Protopolystoma xenopodis]|uniref:Uncharacterized protein n=1 Tax=Protopolystoma xenopodis TaxID=117903 RepID=A0A3S5BAD0_9PLAT|nr:unnamed protein product [Protopolystoma xenopodis]
MQQNVEVQTAIPYRSSIQTTSQSGQAQVISAGQAALYYRAGLPIDPVTLASRAEGTGQFWRYTHAHAHVGWHTHTRLAVVMSTV